MDMVYKIIGEVLVFLFAGGVVVLFISSLIMPWILKLNIKQFRKESKKDTDIIRELSKSVGILEQLLVPHSNSYYAQYGCKELHPKIKTLLEDKPKNKKSSKNN